MNFLQIFLIFSKIITENQIFVELYGRRRFEGSSLAWDPVHALFLGKEGAELSYRPYLHNILLTRSSINFFKQKKTPTAKSHWSFLLLNIKDHVLCRTCGEFREPCGYRVFREIHHISSEPRGCRASNESCCLRRNYKEQPRVLP